MSESPVRFVARHVHDLIDRQRLDALPDQALLRQFLGGDETAFVALVRRHGPLVLGTCRRILRHAQDAEDACQAVFLVLARRGSTVRGGDSLAGWLHRVAVRAAVRFRRLRRTPESLPEEVRAPEPAGDELVWREIRQTFDAEVGRLPDRLRLPLVLCCLQGKTRTEAAAELGWSEGTVRGRLERGRKLLRSRFTRMGLTLPAALLPLLIEDVAPATTPSLIAAPSSVAARLADAVVRSMALARAKLAAWATAAVLVVGTAVGFGVYGPAAAQPKPGETPASATRPPAVTAADAERNLDTFVLRVSLAPAGEGKFDPKYSLYHVLLYVPNLRLEPPANGPDGKPVEAHARITKEQAKKIVEALAGFDFFKDDSAFDDPSTRKLEPMKLPNWPHVGITVRFQNGEDATSRQRMLAWLPAMLPPLDAIRGCVDGEAAKALDQLLAQLTDDRKKWAPDPLAEDLKELQGTWAAEVPGDRLRVDVITNLFAKCTIDGKTIVLKPQVQRNPLMDLETIRGTFELRAGTPHTMTIKGVRDTVSKQESGTWTVPYELTQRNLKLLVPPVNAMPTDGLRPAIQKSERLFNFRRQPTGAQSEWGEPSEGVQTRIRASKAKYATNDAPAFDLDVRDTHAGIAGKPWDWLAPRMGDRARVEVDGVWYRCSNDEITKLVAHRLKLGQTVEKWTTVSLANGGWATEATSEMPARPLALRPGKHKVRVGYDFSASEGERVPASPVSGPVEIEILPDKSLGHASDWGDPSKGVSSRIRTTKAKFAVGEAVAVDLDVKAAGDGGRELAAWRAAKNSSPARLEVGGVWYKRMPDEVGKELTPTLTAGEQVDGWAKLNLSDQWVVEYYTGIPPGQAGQRLTLTPGKYAIRVGFSFSNPTASATPVSGPLTIEVLPPTAFPADKTSDWGESAKGLRTRLRATTIPGALGDERVIALDVKSDAVPDGGKAITWSAGRAWYLAKLEVDGTWYVSRYRNYRGFVVSGKIGPGQQVPLWVSLRLDSPWVAEGTENDESPRALDLKPGKHMLRVKHTFWNGSQQIESVSPISGPLEIDVPQTSGKAEPPAVGPWRSTAAWNAFGINGMRGLAVSDDRHVFTAGKESLIRWDLSRPKPMIEQTVKYTMDGLQFAGLDRDGQPLLFRQSIRPQPNEATTDLTVLRLSDMGKNAKPQLAVPTDTVRQWAVRPDGKALVVGFSWWDAVRLIDFGTGKDRTLDAPKGTRDQLAFLHRLLFSRDGKTLIGLGSNDYPVIGRMNGVVVCWDAASGKVLWHEEQAKGQGTGALSADGRTLVTGGRLGTVATVWDRATGKKVREIPTNGAEAIGVSADGKTVAVGTHTEGVAREPIVEIWDLTEKTVGQRVPVPATVRFVSFRDDGRAFATADTDGEIRWWVREK
jgi:RNA polymerase sigma factor (sigma-70 family)